MCLSADLRPQWKWIKKGQHSGQTLDEQVQNILWTERGSDSIRKLDTDPGTQPPKFTSTSRINSGKQPVQALVSRSTKWLVAKDALCPLEVRDSNGFLSSQGLDEGTCLVSVLPCTMTQGPWKQQKEPSLLQSLLRGLPALHGLYQHCGKERK